MIDSYGLWSLSQLHFFASRFAKSMELIAKIQVQQAIAGVVDVPSPIFYEESAKPFDDLCMQLKELGLKNLEQQAVAIASFMRDRYKFPDKRFLDRLRNGVHDEMERFTFIALNEARTARYNNPLVGWEKVADRFNCGFDIEEAQKCIVFKRHTAAVFHLMKVVEAGVLELQMFLKERDLKAHFGSVVQKLEDMTQKTKYDHVPTHLQPYISFMRGVLPQLHAVKDSWRNKVSHVENFLVPTETFTEELTLGVHDATLLLMKKLLSGLPNERMRNHERCLDDSQLSC